MGQITKNSPALAAPEICLLGASFETPNMGVSALTAGAIRCFVNQWPDAKIFLFDYGKFAKSYTLEFDGRSITVPLVTMRFSKKFYLHNNIAYLLFLAVLVKIVPSAIRRRIIDGNESLRSLANCSLVASVAGGDSFSDIYGIPRLLYVALPQILAIWMGKPLVQMPQTLGPFKGSFARRVARYILSRSDVVYSRDQKGLREVAEILGPDLARAKSKFSYDMGFILQPTPPADYGILGLSLPKDSESIVVGLNVSGLLFGGKSNRRNTFGFNADYDNLVGDLLALLLRDERVSILLTPHVFGQDDESDIVVCKKVLAFAKDKYQHRVGFAAGVYNQSEIKYLIGKCDFFVGSRMHACIAAVSQAVPAVSIAYSDKFTGVMETVGLESLVADPRTMNNQQILAIVEKAYAERDAIREQLLHSMPEIKRTILNMFADQSNTVSLVRGPELERASAL
jgi:colanic acid/amylovoran biosynthesis protein